MTILTIIYIKFPREESSDTYISMGAIELKETIEENQNITVTEFVPFVDMEIFFENLVENIMAELTDDSFEEDMEEFLEQ